MVKRGIQSRGLDLIFGEGEPKQQHDKVIQVKEPMVLYCRDDLNPASRNFTKYPNEIHATMRDVLKGEEAAAIIFVYLWRLSFGFGRNYCRVSLQAVERETVVGSRTTVKRSINTLAAKQFIAKGLLKSGEQDKTQEGCLYRIFMPEEIASQTTEEGVSFHDIPEKGVVILSPPKLTTPEEARNNRDLASRVKLSPPKLTPGQNESTQNEATGGVKLSGAKTDLPSEKRTNKQSGKGGQIESTQIDPPSKEDSLKDSLSPDPVKLFYTGIGQERISKVKREKGDSVLKELQKEGFSPEDIQFAIEWTLKPENTKEKVHDFSIISHTIGQALAAKEATQQAAESARKEAARVSAAEEERKRLEGEIERKFAEMGPDEVAELEKQAREELSGVQAEFITEMSIRGKMKEILGRS